MSERVDLLRGESHFAFGKNWASYANLITERRIAAAVEGLRRLSGGDLKNRRFLDIGCGSGLHALAALRLGAAEVVALDIDSDSVATAKRVLQRHAPGQPWHAAQLSVFELDPASMGLFDVVYSWGVLHHTGDMRRALRRAAGVVTPGGQFIFALYQLTHMYRFWQMEKRWYSQAGPGAQRAARAVYVALLRIARGLKGQGLHSIVQSYRDTHRGMDFYHDVHDWLGGWPYEAISPLQVRALMESLGFREVRTFARRKKPFGLTGAGCDQYVYSRGSFSNTC